jgi:hypothetical protein
MGKITMRVPFIAAALIIAAVPSTAATVKPEISGPYVWTWSETCYPPGDSGVVSTSQTVGVITFNPAKNWATAKWVHNGGNPPTESSQSGSGKYKNTATTFTLTGTTYQAVYGGITGENIATQVSYIGIVPGDGGATCEDEATLVHQ